MTQPFDTSSASIARAQAAVSPATTPAIEAMSVFSGPKSAQDASLLAEAKIRSEIAVTTGSAPVADSLLPGSPEAGKERLLQDSLGRGARSIWAVATSKGRVCAGLTDFTAGCVSDFTAEEPITPNIGRPAANEPVIVWGLAADGVARVDVIADGKATAAKVGGNAYFVELSDASLGEEAVNAIRVGFADSSRAPVTIKLAPLPAQPSLG